MVRGKIIRLLVNVIEGWMILMENKKMNNGLKAVKILLYGYKLIVVNLQIKIKDLIASLMHIYSLMIVKLHFNYSKLRSINKIFQSNHLTIPMLLHLYL